MVLTLAFKTLGTRTQYILDSPSLGEKNMLDTAGILYSSLELGVAWASEGALV